MLSLAHYPALHAFLLQSRSIRVLSTNHLRSNKKISPLSTTRTRKAAISHNMTIKLTEEEDKLCTLLDECTRYMKETEGFETSCRIAGGWVRDKLLGLESHDIDIALSDMMGVTFAQRFVEYCSQVKGLNAKSVAKIESNPDQSKHLETARTTVLGHELDFVNLRSEEYAENSRIPAQITFGTPLQDALRRDITINALFYNVHTREVEDHTGKGLHDLEHGLIRTPLNPFETFRDDPLRVIRAVRFSSRFGFDLVQELKDAARNPEIQEALAAKISRERIGAEIDKMMQARDPLRAISLINELCLYSSVFQVLQPMTSTLSSPPAPWSKAEDATLILTNLLSGSVSKSPNGPTFPNLPPLHSSLVSALKGNTAVRGRLFMGCALTPYRGVTYSAAKDRLRPACEIIIREGLKLGTHNHYLDGVPALFGACELLSPAVVSLVEGGDRRRIGMMLRESTIHNPHTGSTWQYSLIFSLVQNLTQHWNSHENALDEINASERVAIYNRLVTKIEDLKLPATVEAKSLLNGHEIARLLETKPGPWMAGMITRVIEWQLDHPDGTKGECAEWVKCEHAAGNIDISAHTGKRSKQEDAEAGTIKKVKR